MSTTPDKKSSERTAPNPTRRGGGAAWHAMFGTPPPQSNSAAAAPAAAPPVDLSYATAALRAAAAHVSDFSALLAFLDRAAKETGATAEWKDANRKLVEFIAAVVPFDERKREKDEKHWTYHAACAIASDPLQETGENAERVIISYAPGSIGRSILNTKRAVGVANRANRSYSLWDCIKGSSDPNDFFCGVFRDLVGIDISESTIHDHNAKVRLQKLLRTKRQLFTKLQSSCGGLKPGQICSSSTPNAS